ncbi:thioester-containing protein [Elysia marginata]|uniref:Thioester-containing protein n=1 Tax=Elysia marginata TaxID=1093978 RepID=A0AAV4HCN2_9GAST|nr:thioester-containing protein [Elysia marginata]
MRYLRKKDLRSQISEKSKRQSSNFSEINPESAWKDSWWKRWKVAEAIYEACERLKIKETRQRLEISTFSFHPWSAVRNRSMYHTGACRLLCKMMTVVLVMVAMTTSIAYGGSSSGTYVVMSPSKLRPNSDFAVSVNILKAKKDVKVTASISQSSASTPIASANGIFQAGSPGTLNLRIPGNLTDTSYTLKVKGKGGGLKFKDEAVLDFLNKEFSLFIQTDKGIYKAGDTVNFRVFGMYSDLKPYLYPLDISIYDKDSNKIKQWLQVTPKDGVVTQKLQLSSQPTLGDWKISVQASNVKVDKAFSVAEYVLPKFEVSVVLPSYVLTTETDVTATIKAKYTYGKPVNGTADVAVELLSSYRRSLYHDEMPEAVFSFPNVELDGETKVTFPLSAVKAIRSYLNNYKLIVSANVTEDLTGNVMSGNATVTMYDSGVKLNFPKTNPTTFKPGLEYTALLKISQPDGLPVNPGSEKVTVSTTVLVPSPNFSKKQYRFSRRFRPVNYIDLPDVYISVPDNGLVSIPVTAQPNATRVIITAKFSGVQRNLNLVKSHSPSNSYIQMALKTASKIQAGDNIDLEVSSTQPLTQLVYQVLSRGRIVKTGSVTSQNKMVQPFVLATDASMAPNARIVVYYVRADGEIVTDSISFSVDGVFLNKVSVKLNTTKAGPGESVEVTVDADPSSVAHLAAIDQSLLLLRSGNDVTADDVMNELEKFDTISSRKIFWGWPVYYGGNDAEQVLKNSGVTVLTDCSVYDYKRPISTYGGGRPGIVYKGFSGLGGTRRLFAKAAGKSVIDKTQSSSGEQPTAAPTRLRSNFDESWLWNEVALGANGTATTTAKIPDTITSWVVSAFATNQISGLGVAPTQAKLTVFKPFFVSLNLPYSVTRGEHLALQANVFNYLQQDVTVRVTLAKSSDYQNIFIDANGLESWRQEEVYQDVMIAAGEAKSVYFPIKPSALGRIDLDVTATTTIASDRIVKQLLVEAEGVPKEYNVPVLIDLTEGRASFSKTIDLTLPGTIVSGSELVRVSAVGDLMGPTVGGLDTLLRMPTGCGEQTMVGLAPDVYITDYLKAVNQLTPNIESKALGYMERGYQRELTYKHKDGSFSAFGERDESGSMWLTAFVTKVFHQAKPHIFVDENVIKTAINWMIRQQASDGSFPEPGKVLNKKMQGQSAGGVGLTCFVYISLLENQDLFTSSEAVKVNGAMAKALAYLETEVASSSDPYILAMASYAFQLAGSSQALTVLDRLEAMAVKDGGMRYWHNEEAPKARQGPWRSPHGTKAVDTEMTSYVLLAYAVKADIVGGKGIMQWVAQQRNPNGGFTSTQTTKVPSKVHINASGNGMALAEVAVFFNVESEVEDSTFELAVNLVEETMNWLVVETCAR